MQSSRSRHRKGEHHEESSQNDLNMRELVVMFLDRFIEPVCRFDHYTAGCHLDLLDLEPPAFATDIGHAGLEELYAVDVGLHSRIVLKPTESVKHFSDTI